MNGGVHPVLVLAMLGVVAAIAFALAACLARRTAVRWVLACLALASIAPACWVWTILHPEVFDARYRTYKDLYGGIGLGMHRSEVLELVARHYPQRGERAAPKVLEDTEERLAFFMDPEQSSEPNCEGIFLQMRSGRVESKEYSPD